MTDKSVQVVNKSVFLEASDGKVLIPIATDILSPASPVLPKTPTMDHLSLNDATY